MNSNNNNKTVPPLISVVISTRDRGDRIVETVRSCLSNNYSDFEVIVVDQSSNGLTESAVNSFRKDSRFHYLRTETKGVSFGRNIGIHRALGEIIFITDDDCELQANCLKKLAAAFALDKQIGIVFGNVLPGPHDRTAGFIPAYVRSEPILVSNMNEKHLAEGISACMGVRRAVWRTLHGFDQMLGAGGQLKSGAETDFTIRGSLNGYFIYESPDIKVKHHGFRTWKQGQHLLHRYWYGTGAMFSKLLKCGHPSVVGHLFRLARRWLSGGRSEFAKNLGNRSNHLLKLTSFVQGFGAGLFTMVNKTTGNFSGLEANFEFNAQRPFRTQPQKELPQRREDAEIKKV